MNLCSFFRKLCFLFSFIIFSSYENPSEAINNDISSENFYTINNISENEIISKSLEVYDSNQMVFVIGGGLLLEVILD